MPLNLPERASFEYLKKLAKERLAFMRERNPDAKLSDAQFAIAREYGLSSWRALNIFHFDIAPDNRLLLARGKSMADVVLMRRQ